MTRESYIPAGKSELAQRLAADMNGDDAARFADFCRMLSAVMHYETFDELERLTDLYRPLDPSEHPTTAPDPDAFLKELDAILAAASFRDIDHAEVTAAAAIGNNQDLVVKPKDLGLRRIRFFVRGQRPAKVEVRRFWGLHRRQIDSDIFDDVLIVIEMPREDGTWNARAFSKFRGSLRAGAILLKHFGDVPRTDLLTLHPGASPAMKRRDQLILGVPAVAGGVPLLTQLGPALAVIFAVIAGVLGFEGGEFTQDSLKRALAALSGLVALGAFLMRQRLKFDRQRLFYQKQLADTVYFHTIANNAGVLHGLVGAAEEQHVKEAMLAYHELLTKGPMTREALDAAIEGWLREAWGRDIDFDIGDALGKLDAMNIVDREGETWRAMPLDDALSRLDEAWDAYFHFPKGQQRASV
jgi:hypothetical protein